MQNICISFFTFLSEKVRCDHMEAKVHGTFDFT